MNGRNDDGSRRDKVSAWLLRIGTAIVLAGAAMLLFIFGPVLREEVRYSFRGDAAKDARVTLDSRDASKPGMLVPVDPGYSIVIPKIGANVPVVADVDPLDPSVYRAALSKGIAQAKGTVAPGESGNTFLFAHSSDDFLTRGNYNTVFYLLDKLSVGDRFTIAYRGKLYGYRVFDRREVPADRVEYLHALSEENTVTLMTCWPPGTDLRRLLVFGVLEPESGTGSARLDSTGNP
ncbi:MAG: sortase [Candidatus Moranbacteria bacterium]|nr:sortase [Candidatus Moranbacteria bacterium]